MRSPENRLFLLSCLLAGALFQVPPAQAQSPGETGVIHHLQALLEQDGVVYFSQLYNDATFSDEEKEFLGTLYEIFFNIPGFLKTEYQATGTLPSRRHMASSFGLDLESIEVLLKIMESDPRMPSLFTRHAESGEITELRLGNIDAFILLRGDDVQVTRWEGTPLPDFDLPVVGGGRLRRDDLAGSGALIYFWFTGCPPCMRIAPLLARLHDRYAESGFRVVGFNSDEAVGLEVSDSQRADYLEKNGQHFTNVLVDSRTREAFGNVNLFPTLFFAGKDGRIVKYMVNYQDLETLEEAALEVLE